MLSLGRISRGKLGFWIGLLALVELADAVTTGSGIAHGDVEANLLVAAVIAWGGLPLLFLLKAALVALLGGAAALVRLHAEGHPGGRAELAGVMVWRATQLCVVLLAVVVAHNLYLLTPLSA